MAADRPTYQINEQESGRYTALITGDDGAMLPGSTLVTLRLTVYVTKRDGTDQIVNGRDQQNVLNINNVQVLETPLTDANGRAYNLIWSIQPGDTTLVEQIRHERHICLFEWTFAGGAGNDEVYLNVRNVRRVGAA